MAESKTEYKEFQKKVLYIVRVVALVIILLWLLKEVFSVLLLLLAGTLVAMYFRGLAGIFERHTKMSQGVALTISIIGSLLLLAGFFYIAGNSIQQQVDQIKETFPPAVENAKASLSKSSIGRSILEKLEDGNNDQRLMNVAQSFFRSTFGIIGDIYIVLFISIFFTVSPKPYTTGFVKLFPLSKKPVARDVIEKVGYTLKRWLKGQIFAMLVVFVLTSIALIIMGMPMWLVLALFAGLLNFIPNIGPLIAMIPAVIIGFLQGPVTAIVVAGVYILIQTLESSLITPQIQKKMIKVPPALIIIAQLFMGVLTGGWGLLLATPLMVIIMVLVQELHIKKMKQQEETGAS